MVFAKIKQNNDKLKELEKKILVQQATIDILTAQVGDLKNYVKEIKAQEKVFESQIKEVADMIQAIESKEEEIICGAEEQLANFLASQR